MIKMIITVLAFLALIATNLQPTTHSQSGSPTAELTIVAQSPGPRVYVTNSVGGPGGDSVSVIDAGTNTLIATIPVGRAPNGIAVSPDGTRVYVANEGVLGEPSDFAFFPSEISLAIGTPSMEAYDSSGDAWSFMAPIPHFGVGRYLLAAATGPDGRIYGIGGAVTDASGRELGYFAVSAYDSSTDTWSSVSPLLIRRFDLAAATGPDGKVYAIAGFAQTPPSGSDPAGTRIITDLMDAYDPIGDSWTSCGCLPTSLRSGLAAATGLDGRIYIIGGRDHNGNVMGTVEAYEP